MSFTVNIDEAIPQDGFTIVRVTLSDSTHKVRPDEYHVTSLDDLKQKINADISRISLGDSEFLKIPKGIFDPTITPPDQTPRSLFAADVQLLREIKSAVDLGVIDPGDKFYTDQLAKVKQGFNPSFIEIF